MTSIWTAGLKNLARQSRLVTRLYARVRFGPSIPKKDLRDKSRVRLILDVQVYTVLSYSRLSKLYDLASELVEGGVAGAFVECGVCSGGSAGLMAAIAGRSPGRHTWLFDSWEGLPEPGEVDVAYSGKAGRKGSSLGSEEKVRELLFKKLELSPERVHLERGWFEDTIVPKKAEIGGIALLHLDCDWYDSVRLCLEELYDQVVEGGVVLIDDYHYWRGCTKAVDEFLGLKGLRVQLERVDIAAYFQKPGPTKDLSGPTAVSSGGVEGAQ